MRSLFALRLRSLRSLLHRQRVERDLDDEFAFHLARQAEANRLMGMSDEDAEHSARQRFGRMTQEKEACRDHIFGWWTGVGQDARYAVRLLKRSPGFAVFLILTLAFGIGANVAVFSMVHAALLEAPPFPDAHHLFAIAGAYSVPSYESYSQATDVFSGVAAWVDENMSLTARQSPERVHGARVTATFFPVLGVNPILGRSFYTEEDRPDGAPVAMLSFHTWLNRFGGDREIVGKTVRVNAETLTVIGVLPSSFWFPGEPIEVWVPRVFDNRFVSPTMVRNGAGILTGIFARLRPGITAEKAEAALRVIDASPGLNGGSRLRPMQESSTADIRTSLLLLWGAAGCILLVTCANTASLLLARATARRKEIALRLALGVSRFRLARQLLVESLSHAAIAGALGCILARAALPVVLKVAGHTVAGWRPSEIGPPALFFACGATLICAFWCGIVPTSQALCGAPIDGLRDSARGDSSGAQPPVSNALVVAQTAAAVALAITASLLAQNYARMRTLRTGVQTEGLVTVTVRLPDARYHTGQDRANFYDKLLSRVKKIPGVSIVGATSALQLQSKGEGSMTWPEGASIDPNRPPTVRNRNISPDYFRALGIPLVAGRGFTDRDDSTAPKVMLVNESFARRFFSGSQALGRRVTYTSEHVTALIVGVVADVRPTMLDAGAQPEMYFPYTQRSRHEMTIVARSRLPIATLERLIRSESRQLDPELPVYNVTTMDEVVSGVLSQPRSTTSIVAFFSIAALLLAAVGIYAVLSFTVSRRVREIGIRLSLGAQPVEIRGMVVRQSIRLVLAGIGLGVPASLLLARFSSALLFGTNPGDPWTLLAVVAVILGVAWLAAYFPARRAARIDPVRALQSE